MKQGTVSWFNRSEYKRYGFIRPDDGTPDVFVHYSAVEGRTHPELFDGERVQFDSAAGPKGPQAVRVLPLGDKL